MIVQNDYLKNVMDNCFTICQTIVISLKIGLCPFVTNKFLSQFTELNLYLLQ